MVTMRVGVTLRGHPCHPLVLHQDAMCFKQTILPLKDSTTTQEYIWQLVKPLSNLSPLGSITSRREGSLQPLSSASLVGLQQSPLTAFVTVQPVFLECSLQWGHLHRGPALWQLQSRGPGLPNSMTRLTS